MNRLILERNVKVEDREDDLLYDKLDLTPSWRKPEAKSSSWWNNILQYLPHLLTQDDRVRKESRQIVAWF